MAPRDSEDIFDEEPPKSIDPYAVLSINKDATADQVKAAYRKAALLHHPDKVPADQKEAAHTKFQEVAFAYAILSDPRRRSRYDTTGRTEESLSLDDDDNDFNWTDFFRAQYTDIVTTANIEAFKAEYKNSDEERQALLDGYEKFKGSMDKVYEVVMLSNPLEDDERFRRILDEEIAAGNITAHKKYTQESEASRKRRLDKARKEAEEAEEYAEELEEEKKKKSGKKKGGASKKDDVGDLGSLAAMIQGRQRGRQAGQADFLANLEAKYGGKKRGSEDLDDEPTDEAFQKMGARSKKSKDAREETNGGIEGGRRNKRTKK